MSNTVITNYTDLNGPSSKSDGSVVVIVNKDGSLSVDQNLLGTLMGTDGSQASGISVVRVGHEGKPDDATDSETEDDKIPHVTLTVDSYYDEPNSIMKYDSGAEMLHSLKVETRENSLVGFLNDHCYTPLTSPSQSLPQRSESFYDEPIIEISHTPPPKPIPSSKKITILEQKIIPKGKKIFTDPPDDSTPLKGNETLNKPLPGLSKSRNTNETDSYNENESKSDDNEESSSLSSSGDSIPDRDSDSDYKDTKDRSGSIKVKKSKIKPRILKNKHTSKAKLDPKSASRLKSSKNIWRKEVKEKIKLKSLLEKRKADDVQPNELVQPTDTIPDSMPGDQGKVLKHTPKPVKKEKKTPAHVAALLTDMTSLFSTPDVIRRVSTDNKTPIKENIKKPIDALRPAKTEVKAIDHKPGIIKKELKQTKIINPAEKVPKSYDPIPQIDDVSLAQILQDTTGITPIKNTPNITTPNTLSSPGLAGPLSPTLDLLASLQPEEEGLSEDLLMHVAQLVESSENLQEVIDKQVLGKVDTAPKTATRTPFQQAPATNLYHQTPTKSVKTVAPPRKEAIEIVRKDGRVITLPPIEAPATRASKRKSQIETPTNTSYIAASPVPVQVQAPPQVVMPEVVEPEPQLQIVSKQYSNKKIPRKLESLLQPPTVEKLSAESQESWNSEDDPNRLWCICKQPHNNRFMICCDSCEDWFHGKCVNITKAMGQQMEEQGIEWRCPNCLKKTKATPNKTPKLNTAPKRPEIDPSVAPPTSVASKPGISKTVCIVCKKSARASSIYCSDACILKHAQDSLSPPKAGEAGKTTDKLKTESRVIVYERKSGRLLAGPNAPTAENLKAWLQKNPTFEVVRPGTLSTIRPNLTKKTTEQNKIQTTLNFERVPKKVPGQPSIVKSNQQEPKPSTSKTVSTPVREETRTISQPTTPVTPKSQYSIFNDTPKASTSMVKTMSEPRKVARRSHSTFDKAPSVSPAPSRRKDSNRERRQDSGDSIRDNVRKILQEQMSVRMAENTGQKFTEQEIRQFAFDTEFELHELFRDVGMKYKAKYRSLMFNIKDRKNLSLWQKICDRTITPKQLVRLSPEELASQELAQWRDKESKYQLELIKKSEMDLLAASKTYVLKTHKGEEVMETKESISTELDRNMTVEDLVTALNDSTASEEPAVDSSNQPTKSDSKKGSNSRKNDNIDSSSKKNSRGSRRDSESRKSKTSSKKSVIKEKERRSSRRSGRRPSKTRSSSKSRSRVDKSETERSRRRSRSRGKLRRRSKSREHSRSQSQEKDKSPSQDRSKQQSLSKESSRRPSTRSKKRSTSDDKGKHRSRSQDNITKGKNDSTDSDTIERPKSAMMKEIHPEYDPHEPMITSAFSEEDLRKSREDMFEDEYKGEIGEVAYDPTQVFSIDTNVLPPSIDSRKEKTSEAESDQEPSSTVDTSAATVWNGCINMVDVARFYVAAHEVSGAASDLEEDLNAELDIVGRINPDTVWDYISKMKRASNKDIIILRLQAANDEEKMQYIALYSYLSSRNRLGVVKVLNTTVVKDFYIVPLPANTTLPPVLLPLDGPGLGEVKTHLLLAIIIRQRKKRSAPLIPKDIVPAKLSRKRSYTPPTSPRRRQLPLPLYTSPALSTTVKDKIAASLAAVNDDEPYSPGSSTSSGSAPGVTPASESKLKNKMEELNRQIEEQKLQILKMARADSSVGGEDEAYSPSRPMTPPAPVVPLSNISLPSNLQEILATIKQRSEPPSVDVDMRTLPPS